MEKSELVLRRTGRTTRIVDQCIQELFTEGQVECRDHFGDEQSNATVCDMVKRRLINEHPNLFFVTKWKDGGLVIYLEKNVGSQRRFGQYRDAIALGDYFST